LRCEPWAERESRRAATSRGSMTGRSVTPDDARGGYYASALLRACVACIGPALLFGLPVLDNRAMRLRCRLGLHKWARFKIHDTAGRWEPGPDDGGWETRCRYCQKKRRVWSDFEGGGPIGI
jgi:hypothetical protein